MCTLTGGLLEPARLDRGRLRSAIEDAIATRCSAFAAHSANIRAIAPIR